MLLPCMMLRKAIKAGRADDRSVRMEASPTLAGELPPGEAG